MPKPAARLSDLTQHGGVIMPPCALFTMIENLPAARLTDMHTCPMVNVLVPHVGGPIILASFTVFIEQLPAARVQDLLICVGPPDMIAKGGLFTFIGDGMGGAMCTMQPPAPPAIPGTPPMPALPGGPGSPASGGAGAPVDKCTLEGDPVDVATGRMLTFTEEFAVQGAPAWRFLRFYSTSGARASGALGYGWIHNLEERLEIGEELITYCDWQGRRVLFPQIPPDQEYIHHLDENITLRRAEDSYLIEIPFQKTLRFTPVSRSGPRSTANSAKPAPRLARLEAIQDDAGGQITLEYEGDLLRRMTDALGNQYLFDSQDGRYIHAIRFRAREATSESALARFSYDKQGHLVQAADALGQVTRYQYDAGHRMVQKTDRNGHAFSFQYDSRDRCTRTWGQNGLFDQTFLYSDTEPMTQVRDARGRATTYHYNNLGMVTRVVDAQGNEQKFEYQGAHLVKRTDALGREEEFVYDKYARVVKRKSAGGSETQTLYLPDGSLLVTDAEGQTLAAMQQNGQMVVALEGAPAPLLRARRDPEEGALLLEDAAGNTSVLTYDEAERVVAYAQPLGQIIRFEYDAQGHRAAVFDPAGAAVRFGYDPLGRLTDIQREGGSGFRFHYDAEGNLSHFVDGNGRATRFEYAGFNRLAAVTDPAGHTTRYLHDDWNRLCGLTDARTAQTLFDYDELGRLHRTLYPDGRCDYRAYDAAGQMRRFLDRGQFGADCDYDPDGHLSAIRWVDGTELAFAYDKNGRIVSGKNADAEVAFAYDGLGRLVRETQNGAEITYTYDETGALVLLGVPGGDPIRFGYDANGRLSRVVEEDAGEHRFTYSDAGPVETHRYPNGLVTRYRLSRLGLPVEMSLSREHDRQTTVTGSYRYDGNDAITECIDSMLGRAAYQYDAVGRVQAAQRDGDQSEAFAYDPSGNVIARNGVSGYVYDNCNRLQGGPGVRCRHDERGNVVEIEQAGAGAFRFAYNGQNLLTQATLPDGAVVEYAYDPFGRRIYKRHKLTETRYLWAGNQLLEERTTGSKAETRRYLFLPNSFTPIGMRVNGTPYYFHTDHRGAPTRVSDSAGDFVWSADYAAFGEAHVRLAEIEHSLRLPGQVFDPETGLHYNRARYYHPQWGRYLSADPLGFEGGLNLYLYAGNDPINRTDPLGMAPKEGKDKSLGGATGDAAKNAAADASNAPVPDTSSPAGQAMQSNPTSGSSSGPTPTPTPLPTPASGTAGCSQGLIPAGNAGNIANAVQGDIPVPGGIQEINAPTGERLKRLEELAKDPAQGGKATVKTTREAEVGMALEDSGKLPRPIKRDPTGAADFIDGKGQSWDVKAFNSRFKNGYRADIAIEKIGNELEQGESVILDTKDLTPENIAELRNAIEKKGWADKVIWYPSGDSKNV